MHCTQYIVCILPCSSLAGTAIRQARLRTVYGVFQVSVGWNRPVFCTECLNSPRLSADGAAFSVGKLCPVVCTDVRCRLSSHAGTADACPLCLVCSAVHSSTGSPSPAVPFTTPAYPLRQGWNCCRAEARRPRTRLQRMNSCHVMSGAPARIRRADGPPRRQQGESRSGQVASHAALSIIIRRRDMQRGLMTSTRPGSGPPRFRCWQPSGTATRPNIRAKNAGWPDSDWPG